MLLALGPSDGAPEGVQMGRRLFVGARLPRLELGPLEVLVADLPRLASQIGKAVLAGGDEPVEDGAETVLGLGRDAFDLFEAAIEDRLDGRQVLADPLLRLRHPEQGLAQIGRGLEILNPVMGEAALQALEERSGQIRASPLDGTKVGPQVLVGAVRLLAGVSVRVGPGPRQRADIGKSDEGVVLAPQKDLVVRNKLPRGRRIPGH